MTKRTWLKHSSMAVMVTTSLLMFTQGGQAYAAPNNPAGSVSTVNTEDSAKMDRVVSLAKSLIGKDYKYGANGPTEFDSAGLPAYIYGKVGIELDDSVKALFKAGTKVSEDKLQPGDAVFFSSNGSETPNYMGIYIGDDAFIYSSEGADEVIEKSMTSSQMKKFVGARHYLDTTVVTEPDQDQGSGKPPVVTEPDKGNSKPPVVTEPDKGNSKPPVEKPTPAPGTSALADQVITNGEKYMKTPYKFGSSSSTTSTFDCSSFVQRAFKEAGIKLPRDSRQQGAFSKEISKSELRKGDLIFFRSYGSSNPRITHVAIYAGNDQLLHTYGKPGVTYSKFSGTSWEKRVQKYGRVLPQ